jgi:hypothetical protein
MTEMLGSSGFYGFAGFALPCDLRETITIAAGDEDQGHAQPVRHEGGKPPWMITEVAVMIGVHA